MLYFSLKRIRNIFLRIFFLHNKVCLCNGTGNCRLNCFSKEMLYYIDFKCASITFLNKQRKQPGKYQCLCVHEIRLLHIFEISSMYFKWKPSISIKIPRISIENLAKKLGASNKKFRNTRLFTPWIWNTRYFERNTQYFENSVFRL